MDDADEAPARPSGVEAELWQALRDADRLAAKIEDLKAGFVQQKFTALLRRPMESSGEIWAAGDRTHWVTREPRKAAVAIRGAEVRMYYPEHRLVEVYQLEQYWAAGATPRLTELAREFDLSHLPADALPPVPDAWAKETSTSWLGIRLKPRHDMLRERIESIDLQIDPATGVMRRCVITDPDGDRTDILLHSVELNTSFDRTKLNLDVPAGVRVVRPLEGDA